MSSADVETATQEGGEEIERKYLVNADRFPPDMTEAMREGKQHPDISRRGRITQLYLPVKKEIVRQAVTAIMVDQNQRGDPKLSIEDRNFYERVRQGEMQNVSEVRVLQRENSYVYDPDPATAAKKVSERQGDTGLVAIPDGFQITIKGKASEDGVVRPNIETPITTDPHVCMSIAHMLEQAEEQFDWREDDNKVEKMWYDLYFYDPDNTGKRILAELDIFPDLDYMAIAEIEAATVADLNRIDRGRPLWLAHDVTSHSDLKVRNLISRNNVSGLSPETMAAMKKLMGIWMEQLYQPTILGESIPDITDQVRQKSFVVVGSFKKWLPHIRRIVQELERRAAPGNIYPHIYTLDVARRQSTDDPKAAFRIKEEEKTPDMLDAEMNYVNQIRSRDALYVVAPEGRLGESSGREAIEAYFAGKEIYLMHPITSMSENLDEDTRAIISDVRRAIERVCPDADTLRKTNITPIIAEFLERRKCGDGKLQRIQCQNMDRLLGKAEESDK